MTMPAAKDERSSIARHIAASLRDAIVCLELQPGDRISESEIAARFGVSRQPVREAFIQLAEAGLLRVRPQRATEVVKISVRAVANMRFIREALEVPVMRKAAASGRGLARDHFDDLLARQSRAAEGRDFRLFHALDDAFHHEIARIADCAFVWTMIDQQKMQMDRVRYLTLRFNSLPVVEEHRRIADALLEGDADAVENHLRKHLARLGAHIGMIRDENRAFFADDE